MPKQTEDTGTLNLENQIHLCGNTAISHTYQRVGNTAPMSEATRSALHDNVLQFKAHNHKQEQTGQDGEDGITALYERLSNEDGVEGESNSIAHQKKILERYCKEHGYTPFRHYDEDDGYSGTSFQRPGFQRMLADIKAGKIVRVVVKDMSRFGRDYLQVGMYTDVMFPEFGVHFVAVNDNVDSKRGDSEFTAIRNIFNEMHARDTSKKVKATFQSKGRSGEHLNPLPPYGYMKDPANPKKWIVDEEAAAIVQLVYSLCIDGKGPTQIAKWLQDNRVQSPSAHMNEKGLPVSHKMPKDPYRWNEETIARMLERIDYLGHTLNFRTTKQSYKSKKITINNPEDWLIFENTHEPIIEESVFLIVQNLRKSKRRPTKFGDTDMFSGLMYCADCGGIMYHCRTQHFEKRQEYFVCSNYRNKKGCDSPHTIRNVVIEELVLKNLREAISYVSQYEADFIREASDLSEREQDRELAAKKDRFAKAERRVTELDLIIKRLYEDNISGKLTDERFIKLSRDYEREQDEQKTVIIALSRELKERERSRTNVKSFIAATKKYTDLKELDATVLREFIDRINVSAVDKASKTRDIEIVYNFIGAFDFGAVTEQSASPTKQEKTA
jgi:DNA invertase Pin-like site-specific DNA recombinase